jgi:phenylacetate-coenzyme A ligase PaaK-like adenylate-forming protein
MANIDPATATIDDLTNSEPLSEEDRDAITMAWAAPVHNLWGSTSLGLDRDRRSGGWLRLWRGSAHL